MGVYNYQVGDVGDLNGVGDDFGSRAAVSHFELKRILYKLWKKIEPITYGSQEWIYS